MSNEQPGCFKKINLVIKRGSSVSKEALSPTSRSRGVEKFQGNHKVQK